MQDPKTRSGPALSFQIAPGPKNSFNVLRDMRRKDQLQAYLDAWREYGDLVRFQIGPQVIHLVSHPDHVKQVLAGTRGAYHKGLGYKMAKLLTGEGLLTSEGDLWQRQRRLMQPPFTARGVTRFAGTITQLTEAMLNRWEALADRGEPVEIGFEMTRLTMSVIGQTMFSMDVSEHAGETGEALGYLLRAISERSLMPVGLPLWVPTPGNRRFNAALETLDQFVYKIMAERRQETAPPADLLTTLLTVKDEETGQGMSDKQIRDEVITIFLAGHETTAQTLTWAWYLLSKHPEVERKLQAELSQALGGRAPTVADLHNLPYTGMIIDETLRLYPPLWAFPRQAARADEIGGYHIPADSLIILSPYISHHHPDFWDNPEGFDPERFTPERSAGRPHYAYYPFGGGPRTCLGNNFALLEAALVLATVAQKYRLSLVPGQKIYPRAAGTLRPAHGVLVTLQPR